MRIGSSESGRLGPEAAQPFRFALIVSRFNEDITSNLASAAERTLREHGARVPVDRFDVPGAYEIPFVAKRAAETGRYDAIVCLGCVIRGETPHFDYICQWVSHGIGQVGLDTGVPAVFGVLTTDTLEQAVVRSSDNAENKGAEAARCAIELAILSRTIVESDHCSP